MVNITNIRKDATQMRNTRPPPTLNIKLKSGAASYDIQLEIAERTRLQIWPGVSITWFSTCGRGLVATTRFDIGDVVVD